MKKYNVIYNSGESRNGNTAIDYMIAWIGDIDLYEEMDAEPEDETATYDDLKAAIIRLAEKKHIDPGCLHFPYDEDEPEPYRVVSVGGDHDGETVASFKDEFLAANFAIDHEDEYPEGLVVIDPDGNELMNI